jgi:chloride channel protein, CIC family
MPKMAKTPDGDAIPSTLRMPGAAQFWLAILLTGVGTGLGAAALTRLLELIQHIAWHGSATNILDAAEHASVARHLLVLLGAGLLTGAGQIILRKLSSGNGIDTTAAILLDAGRMPALRTLGSAVLSIFVVGMGASLGREGAPKQAGAVMANFFSDKERLSDEERRLLVACGAGAGMAAAYGVPLGGRAICAGSDAREVGPSICASRPFYFHNRHCGFMVCAAERSDLHHSSVL